MEFDYTWVLCQVNYLHRRVVVHFPVVQPLCRYYQSRILTPSVSNLLYNVSTGGPIFTFAPRNSGELRNRTDVPYRDSSCALSGAHVTGSHNPTGGTLDTLQVSALEAFAAAKASAARSKAAVGAALNKKRSPPDPNYPDKKQATQHDLEVRHALQMKVAVMEAEKASMSRAEVERKERNDEATAERKEQYLQLMAAKVDAEGARASHEAFKDGQISVAALQAQQQPPPPYQQQQQPPPPYQPLHHQQQLVYQQPRTMYQPHQPQLLQQQTQMPLTPQPLLLSEPMQGPPLQPPQTHPPAQLLENNQQMYPPLPTPTQQSTQQQLQLYQPQPYQPQQHQHQQYQPQQPPPLFYPPHQQPQQQPYQQHPQNQQPQYLQTQQPQQQQQQHQHQQYQPYQQPPPLFYPPHQQPQQQHPQNQQPQALQQQQPHQNPEPHQPPP